MIGIYSICEAKPWYDYDVYTNPADGDHFLINDISETGPPDNNAAGTLKRLAWLYVQPRDSDLTAIAALTTATYGRALLAVATELAFQQLVNLEIGVDVQAYHINLDAIADAETGVADPAITMYDSSAAAGTADIFGTSTGAYDIIMSLWVDVAGDPTEYLQIDGVSETVDVLKPIIPSKGIGIPKTAYTANYDIQTADPTICEKEFIMGSSSDADVEFELPASGFCDVDSATVRQFYFINNETGAAYVMYIDPNGTDNIQETGQAVCTNGFKYACTDGGTFITVIGVGSNGWYVIDHNGNCDCHSE